MEGGAQLLDEEGEVVLVVAEVGAGPRAWGRSDEVMAGTGTDETVPLKPGAAEQNVHWNITGWPTGGQLMAN